MTKNITTKLIRNILFSCFVVAILLTSHASAAFLDDDVTDKIYTHETTLADNAGFQDITIGEVMTVVIAAFLSMLGMVFLILMLIGGYKWMNAQGNEETVKEAKSSIQRAIIGLIITIGAYAITYTVFNAIDWLG